MSSPARVCTSVGETWYVTVCMSRTERVITFPIFDLPPRARPRILINLSAADADDSGLFFNDLQRYCRVVITTLASSLSLRSLSFSPLPL